VNFAYIIGMMCEELNEQDFPEDMGIDPANPNEVIHPEHNPGADTMQIPTKETGGEGSPE